MRKLSIVTIFLFIAAIAMVGCKGQTELAFKNSPLSSGPINDIVWADGDASWNSATGWDTGEKTGAKEVSETSGTVTCDVDSGSGFVAALVQFPESGNDSSLSLNEGESQTYELQAE
jgi:hypothetical protein